MEYSSDEKGKPYAGRGLCPYFGFRFGTESNALSMIDFKGKQCALKDINSFCHMEAEGDTPNWPKCSLNIAQNWEGMPAGLEGVRVFPKECFRPGFKGIPIFRWIDGIALQSELLEE